MFLRGGFMTAFVEIIKEQTYQSKKNCIIFMFYQSIHQYSPKSSQINDLQCKTNNLISKSQKQQMYDPNNRMSQSRFDYSFKFILVGDTGVGKTSLISRFIDGNFYPNHEYTIGVQYGSKNISIGNKIIKLQIWDTAGQEEFRAITRSYYRSSAAALVVFDLTRKETFRSVVRWVEDVKNNSNKDVRLVLIGNKTDLPEQRMVSRNEAIKLSRDYDMLYLETSAKSQQNVEMAFLWPATNILEKVEGGHIQVNREDQAIKVNREKLQKPTDKECEC